MTGMPSIDAAVSRPRTLVITAVDAERNAVLRDLGPARSITVGCYDGCTVDTPAGEVHAISSGVGPVAAAIAAATVLAQASEPYDAVISAGIGGAFRGRAPVGGVVAADRVTFADLGARTDGGHLTLRQMGLPQDSSYALGNRDVLERLRAGPARVVSGEILTLACMTATDADAADLAARYPGATAEAMEGFGVIEAALRQHPVPVALEIRAISNVIEKRDPSKWRMPQAFDALSLVFASLFERPLPGLSR